MTLPTNTFRVEVETLEIGRNGNIMPRERDLQYDATLKGSLLTLLYPNIKVASVLTPVEPLDEIQETRVSNAMSNFTYKGIRYKLVGAASSAKKGLFYFVDEKHQSPIVERFQKWPQAAITYFGILVSNCQRIVDLADARVLVVKDKYLGTNDCAGWIRASIGRSQLQLDSGSFSQFRIAFDKTQGKGSFKVMGDDVADLLDADVILPYSSVKPGLRLLDKNANPFAQGTRFRGRTLIGIREVARQLQFESSYTLTQHAPAESVLSEILPETVKQIEKVSKSVGEGQYGDLLELIGHKPNERVQDREFGTVEGVLLADKSGHIVRHPWVNSQLDRLLARWTYKACTGGAFRLPAFALAHDGYLVASEGKVYHGADWISRDDAITSLDSSCSLCVRYPIRSYEDLLPLLHVSPQILTANLQKELEKQGCSAAVAIVPEVIQNQLMLAGTMTLHSETAQKNGGDFDFDLIAVIEESRFPLWVSDRFNLVCADVKDVVGKTKTKQKHPWWNIVRCARKAVGNQIGTITDLITSCLADGRPDHAHTLVKQLQYALDSLKFDVAPEEDVIAVIRQEVSTAPWLRLKHKKRVSELPTHLDVKPTDKIGILYNHVRPYFDESLISAAQLEAFTGLIQGEEVTEKMLEQCRYVRGAYAALVADIAQEKQSLEEALDKAKQEWDSARKSGDKALRKQKLLAKNQAHTASHYYEERSKDRMKAIISFLKIWAQNKTTNRMAWAQALNTLLCEGKSKNKGTGSLIWLTFPQELVSRLAEITDGENVHLYTPRLVEGFPRIDEHGRTFLVEAIQGSLVETFLFAYRDGKFSLDPTLPAPKPQPEKSEECPEPPAIEDPEGVGHEIPDELLNPSEEAHYEAVPF